MWGTCAHRKVQGVPCGLRTKLCPTAEEAFAAAMQSVATIAFSGTEMVYVISLWRTVASSVHSVCCSYCSYSLVQTARLDWYGVLWSVVLLKWWPQACCTVSLDCWSCSFVMCHIILALVHVLTNVYLHNCTSLHPLSFTRISHAICINSLLSLAPFSLCCTAFTCSPHTWPRSQSA